MIVRADLSPGAQAAQATHAAFAFSAAHPDVASSWLRDSQFLVIVSVPDEEHLAHMASLAFERGITRVLVREPDLADALTAVVVGPGLDARRLCANLPLALREAAMA